MNAIEVKKLNKSFSSHMGLKKTQVLHDLDFSVEKNKVTGFLGPNGSGKTTTFKIMMGLLLADSGEVLINGQVISQENKKYMGFMPERPAFPDHLNASEFLRFLCGFHKVDKLANKIEASLDLVGLKGVGKKLIKDFSKGMVQRLGLAQAIIHQPEIIILDEPMSGLDPNGRHDLIQIIKEIAESGKTVFLSSHLLDDIQRLCDDIVLIQNGVKVYSGSVVDIQTKISAQYRLTYALKEKKHEEIFTDYDSAVVALEAKIGAGAIILGFSPYRSFEAAVLELQK